MIKETWQLIRWLFSKPPETLEYHKMRYYPFSGYSILFWCGRLVGKEKPTRKTTWTHETIHSCQAKVLYGSYWKFYLAYLWNWIIGAIWMLSWDAGYYTGKFETEAYANQENENYPGEYKKGMIKKYTFTLRERSRLWKETGKSRWVWKEMIKDL